MEESRFAASQARMWQGASLGFQAGGRREGSSSGPRYAASILQPLPIWGKPVLRGAVLDVESESRRVGRTGTELEVALDVIRLAYAHDAARRKAEYARERLKRFELVQKYLAGRVFPTPQRKAESLIVANKSKDVAAEAIRHRAEFAAVLEKLRLYAPLPPGTQPEIEVPRLSGKVQVDEDEWRLRAMEGNPGIRIRKLAVRRAKLEKELASNDALPDPGVSASYEQARAAETERSFGLGFSLALPAWNGNRAGVRSAKAGELAQERRLAFAEQALSAEISRHAVEYEAARGVMGQYPEELTSELRTQIEEAQEGFRRGQIDLLTFLELDESASEAFDRVLDAQRELAARITELMAAAGEPDPLARLKTFYGEVR